MNKSTERLVSALREAGLTNLADRAATEEFHDFASPHDLPATELVKLLKQVSAKDMIDRVIDGEFDADADEGEAWAQSLEGQAAFRKLKTGE